MLNKGEIKIIYHAVDGIDNLLDSDETIDGSELHHKLFNEDYFIIGRYEAEKFLQDCGGVFKAIDEIIHYEKSNMGEVSTNLAEAEHVANMYAYIRGEEFLSKCSTFGHNWDEELSLEDLQQIKDQLLKIA
jgi:hypothetical protein